jgi:hypothetical protein
VVVDYDEVVMMPDKVIRCRFDFNHELFPGGFYEVSWFRADDRGKFVGITRERFQLRWDEITQGRAVMSRLHGEKGGSGGRSEPPVRELGHNSQVCQGSPDSLDLESWQVIGGLPGCHLPRHLSTHNADFAEQLETGSVQFVQVLLAGEGFAPIRANDPCHWEFAATVFASQSVHIIGRHGSSSHRRSIRRAAFCSPYPRLTSRNGARRNFLCYEADDLSRGVCRPGGSPIGSVASRDQPRVQPHVHKPTYPKGTPAGGFATSAPVTFGHIQNPWRLTSHQGFRSSIR